MIKFGKALDISITIEHAMPVYPGDPRFEHREVSSFAGGDTARVSAFNLCAHTGTHLDLPSHFFDGQPTLESLPPENFIMPAVLIDSDEGEAVGPEAISSSGACAGEALLIRTTNSSSGVLSDTEFRRDYVYLAPEAAEAKPVEAKPAEANPAEAKPAETNPAEAKPAEAKPDNVGQENEPKEADNDNDNTPLNPLSRGEFRS